MQSHDDFDARSYEKALKEKAEEMTRKKENLITAGKPGEEEVFSAQVGTIFVCRRPTDPLALRISIGEGASKNTAYCVFRGDEQDCLELLERALAAMKAAF